MRKSPRDRRLLADAQSLAQLRDESTIFDFSATGNPPHSYRLYFKGTGVTLHPKGQVVPAYRHEVIVELGAAYPRLVPNLAWQTPIFHPNISHNGVVCLGGYGTHWVPSLTLSEMCIMLWDMIRFANFDTESPYNREAAMWARMQPVGTFPLDHRSLKDRITEGVIHIGDEEIIETGVEIVSDGLNSNPVQPDILFID